jgi:diadenosine tetraphosphatase ApaH/serine/threonine PP2A family protein phosphatase
VLEGELPEIVRTGGTELILAATASFSWTRGAITAIGAYDWLASLPVEQRMTLPDGTHVLLVHASPGADDGPGIYESMTDQDLVDCGITAAQCGLIFVGHTHRPLDRTVAGTRVVNLGSVSVPAKAERRAMWTLLSADENSYTIERRFSAYDIEGVCAALDAERHPSAEWLKTKLRHAPSDQ